MYVFIQFNQSIQVFHLIEDKQPGGNFRAHLPWASIDTRVLILIKEIKSSIKAPGNSWYPDWYYKQVIGELTEERMKEGHRLHVHEGKNGVWVPDAPIVRFRESTSWVSQLQDRHKADEALDQDALLQVGTDFVQGNTPGGVGASSGLTLEDTFNPLDEDDNATSPVPKAGQQPVPLRTDPPVMPTMSDPTSPQPQATPKGRARAKAKVPSQLQCPVPKPEQQDDQAGKSATPQKGGRGRKPKAWANLVDVELSCFAKAEEHSNLWNGQELPTKIKNLISLEKEINKRLATIAAAKTPDEHERQLCQAAVKKATNVICVLEAVQSKGLASEELAEAFDRAQTSLVLAPAAHVEWPSYIKWSRQRLHINSHTGDATSWVQKIGTGALTECGVKNVQLEQQTFLSEYLSQALKMPELKACMQHLLALVGRAALPQLQKNLDEDITEFCFCLSEKLDPPLRELQARYSALNCAVALFNDAEDMNSDLPDCQRYLCNLVLGFPKGRKLVDDAKVLAHDLHRDLQLLKGYDVAATKFTMGMDEAACLVVSV